MSNVMKRRWKGALAHWVNKLEELRAQPDKFPAGEEIARGEIERLQEEGKAHGFIS
tara:strand:+ start:900 stop:1067 length:168 start_codon:yes stop_codon:yes gene_type:complete